jgi:hypothetical protein
LVLAARLLLGPPQKEAMVAIQFSAQLLQLVAAVVEVTLTMAAQMEAVVVVLTRILVPLYLVELE